MYVYCKVYPVHVLCTFPRVYLLAIYIAGLIDIHFLFTNQNHLIEAIYNPHPQILLYISRLLCGGGVKLSTTVSSTPRQVCIVYRTRIIK